jgi:prepilin-type N-terminal cleavage/methylation domain-containing protein
MTSFAKMRSQSGKRWGFSMIEMAVVISVVGILATIAIANYGDLVKASGGVAVRDRAEWLNSKVKAYQQIYGPLGSASVDAARVIKLLQEGPSGRSARPGLPFVPLSYTPTISGDSNEYRLQWVGNAFKPLNRGQSGRGILMNTESSDMIGN